ncbi:MAG: MEDS domain-containing protein [Halopenitus sp.]
MSRDVGEKAHRDLGGHVRKSEFGTQNEAPKGHDHDHAALLYESRAEQFDAVAAFLREGIERDERCLYIAAEHSRPEVLAELRERDVDVDWAVDEDLLTTLTPAETYHRTGEFDEDAMLEFWEDAIEATRTDADATGLRAAAEMDWVLDSATTNEELTDYEAVLNPVFETDSDPAVLCQYDRDRFPADVLEDVVRTHPKLASGKQVSWNVYYTPPERYFAPTDPAAKVDRMLDTVHERSEAKTALREHKTYLQDLYEIAADPDLPFDRKVERVLDLGRDRFDLSMGFFLKQDGDEFQVLKTRGTPLEEGSATLCANSDHYCKRTVTVEAPVGVEDAEAAGWGDDPLYQQYDLGCYIGTRLTDGTETFGSVCFSDDSPREREFTDAEYTFLDLLGQWLSYELERRRRERELRQSKQQLKRIFESSHDAIYIIDPKADEILGVNQAGCELLGLSRTQILERGPSDFHPNEMDRFQEFVGEVYETGSGWTDELTCLHRSGRTIPVEMTASRIQYDGRQCMLAIARDISDRRERERELEQAKRQFEAVFDNPVSFVGILDPDGTVRRINETALEFTDADESALRGEKFWDCPWFDHSAELRDELREVVGRAADGEYVRAELPHRGPDGEERILDSMLEPVRNDEGEVVAIVPSGHDITELRESEQSQRQLYEIVADPTMTFEEKLQDMLDLGCDHFDMDLGGVARVDPDTDWFEVELINDDHEHLEPGTTYPLSETFSSETVTDDGAHAVPDVTEYPDKLPVERFDVQSYLGTHFEVPDGDDRTLWFISNEPATDGISDADRTFNHLMGQWVKYELERQNYEADLERTIDQLQQSNDRLKQFAYAASHDLQEPLRMVSSYLQLLEEEYVDELDDDAHEYIDFALDGASRMRTMVEDLLAFSRVEHADGTFEPVDCDAVLDRVLENYRMHIDEANASVTVDPLPTVQGDEEQLEQLFANLVANAVKYNDGDAPQVEVSATERADHWEFAVADDGIGIAPEKTDRIFEVFKRLHHADEYSGTGIGLSLCQEIVENHGGDIDVESEPGVGSTFTFTIRKRPAE